MVFLVSALIGALQAMIDWLVSVLPENPLAGVDVSVLATWAGWVCWVLPLGQMLQILVAWLGALLVFTIVRWVYDHTFGLIGKVIG